MGQQSQEVVTVDRPKRKSTYGTELMVQCQRCRKSFNARMSQCPYCGNTKFRR